MIKRSSPDLDYVPSEVSHALAFSQLVSNHSLLFLAGIAPVSGSALEIVGAGDIEVQCRYILDVLDRSLKAGGSSREHILQWTVYLVDASRAGQIGTQYEAIAPILSEWVGPHRPAATAVGVAGLSFPEQLIEIRAVAAVIK